MPKVMAKIKHNVAISHIFDPDDYATFAGICFKRSVSVSAALRAMIRHFLNATPDAQKKIIETKTVHGKEYDTP